MDSDTSILVRGILTADDDGRLSLVDRQTEMSADDVAKIGSAYRMPTTGPKGWQAWTVLYAGRKYHHLRMKESNRVDWLDAGVDAFGIVGDAALLVPGGQAIWAISEVPELLTIGRSFDQLEAGDPSGLVVDVGVTLAQGLRLLPEGGFVANIFGLGMNFLEFSP